MQKDEQALGIIITSLHDNYIHFINECEHAHDVWEILEKNFGAKAKRSKIGLKKQFYKLCMNEGEDIASLVNRLRSMVTQLTYLEAQEDKVAVIIGALPPSYDHIVTILEEKEPTPSLEDIVSSLQKEEKKLPSTSRGGAYIVTKSDRKCYQCGQKGHIANDCFCSTCGEKGHPPSRCPKNGASSSKGKQAITHTQKPRRVNLVDDSNKEDNDSDNHVSFVYGEITFYED